MEHFSAGLLKIEVQESGTSGPIELFWSGRSTDRSPAKLVGPYLSQALALAQARRVALAMHFERLEYFNSSTISLILTTLHEAQQHKVKMIVSFDASVKWQASNFATMRQLFLNNENLELRPLPAAKAPS
jgi:hypothetical protein